MDVHRGTNLVGMSLLLLDVVLSPALPKKNDKNTHIIN